MSQLLIELQYLGPVSYYALFLKYKTVLIEGEENFVKASYRNRCYIGGPNGRLRLTVPLEKGKHQHSKYKDVLIFYEEDWQKIHWQSFVSSYRSSPFFEYYEHHFEPFYKQKTDCLFQLNLQLMNLMLKLLNIDIEIEITTSYKKHPVEDIIDYRSVIRPNKPHLFERTIASHPYPQVFENKTGFLPDLSIADLLFNEGPQAKNYLLQLIEITQD